MKREIIAGPRAAYTSPLAEVLSLGSEESILIGSEESILIGLFNVEAQNDTWEEFEFNFDD